MNLLPIPRSIEAMRNFKATTMVKNTEGVAKLIDDIIMQGLEFKKTI